MTIKEYSENAGHRQALTDFLASPAGLDLISAMRGTRRQLTTDTSASELRLCGRHDVFQAIEDLFFAAITPPEPRRAPVSEKGGATVRPFKAALP